MQPLMPDTPGWVLLLMSMVLASIAAAALNYAIEKIAYRPLRNAPKLAPLIWLDDYNGAVTSDSIGVGVMQVETW